VAETSYEENVLEVEFPEAAEVEENNHNSSETSLIQELSEEKYQSSSPTRKVSEVNSRDFLCTVSQVTTGTGTEEASSFMELGTEVSGHSTTYVPSSVNKVRKGLLLKTEVTDSDLSALGRSKDIVKGIISDLLESIEECHIEKLGSVYSVKIEPMEHVDPSSDSFSPGMENRYVCPRCSLCVKSENSLKRHVSIFFLWKFVM
jgi:hypothetical protein